MKKIALILFAIVLALVVFNVYSINSEETVEVKKPTTETIDVSADHVTKGNLLLINKDHKVNEEALPNDLLTLADHPKEVVDFQLADSSIQISKKMLQAFQLMVQDAKNDGVSNFIINSSYRSTEQQAKLFKSKGEKYALPAGSSEHNLGMSMDIGSTLGLMENAKEGKWLAKNAVKYGFILRYPSDKTAITGIQYEAWHFRYVGIPHSYIMKKHDWVLEEYLAYLKTHDKLTETVRGIDYTVAYHKVNKTSKTAIQIPLNQTYLLSGDNDEGVIVTYWAKQQQDDQDSKKTK